ncbi:hypothetical protein TVAG_276130 [Trichomonas vaginalis G3]|uniref:Ubiquitin-like domain-containing protein n=1 Tax=Trichomonas vaginalis (strain ATCC PRA-98 / G3) TaxID=412133 RepID=A2ECP4_TRIV3|nr:modification-dependent protein catabolic process [Trichomonas vaginalis G3]EAY09540.1 hypothetical protein TVAG_276130 [Trichomonas vaginalis G3]KAI5533167.1 modification-dependent protein catabolic process [Trichomonas vaginalis G3]|eukprot:XP_001321763.1 hypothetical protein [Trichomonas vaginalis G3]
MVIIGIQWARGILKININRADTIQRILMQISEQIKVPADKLTLYYDSAMTSPMKKEYSYNRALASNPNKSLASKLNSLIYLKIDNGVQISNEFNSGVSFSNAIGHSIMGSNATEEEKKKVIENANGFAKNAITVDMFRIADRSYPIFGVSSLTSTFAIRIPQNKILLPFQQKALMTGYKTHRIMFLFGRIDKYTGKVTVHCSCEPQQKNFVDHVEILEEFNMDLDRNIAHEFGMECVGMAISRPEPTEKSEDYKHEMTEYMVRLAAKYQVEITEYFTTIVVTEKHAEPYQASDAAMKAYQQGLFLQSSSPTLLKFKSEVKLGTAKHLKELDSNYAVATLRIRNANSHFPDTEPFPPLSEYPSVMDVKKYFDDMQYCPMWYRLFNFNLLLYFCYERIIPESAIGDVIHQIIHKANINKSVVSNIDHLIGQR